MENTELDAARSSRKGLSASPPTSASTPTSSARSSSWTTDRIPHVEHDPQRNRHELDKHIIGQQDAKRAVAIALRNRWRRMQVEEVAAREDHAEEHPDDRARPASARPKSPAAWRAWPTRPFVKVEATKFTEVGYVGRDVESDRPRSRGDGRQDAARAGDAARALSCRRGRRRAHPRRAPAGGARRWQRRQGASTRQLLRKKLREGELDDKEIELEITSADQRRDQHAPPGMEEMTSQLQSMFWATCRRQSKRRHVTVKESPTAPARRRSRQAARRGSHHPGSRCAPWSRTASSSSTRSTRSPPNQNRYGAGVSREGVQRDLLPLIEGTTVSTKYGR
jgi:ATP-dependent HslUV protease ATP-binding subunit HslU